MNLQKSIIEILEKNELRYKNFSQLFLVLSKKLKENPENIAKTINKMISDGILMENSRRQLVLSQKAGYRKGAVFGNPRGFAFIKPLTVFDKISKTSVDFFVPANKLAGALDGDIVLFREEPDKSTSIFKILKRKNKNIIGKVVPEGNIPFGKKKDGNFVVADNDKFSKPIFVSDKEIKGAKQGDRVEVELIFQPEGSGLPIGKVKRILTENEMEIGIASILCEYQIPDIFPESVINEAENLSVDYEKELI